LANAFNVTIDIMVVLPRLCFNIVNFTSIRLFTQLIWAYV